MSKNRKEYKIGFMGVDISYSTETESLPSTDGRQQPLPIASEEYGRSSSRGEAYRGSSSRGEEYGRSSSRGEAYRGSSSRDEACSGSSSRGEEYGRSSSRGEEYGRSSSRGNNIQSQVIAFYKNEIPSQPNGDFIDNILNHWYGNYNKLDDFDTYIQWLFPSRERGKNSQAPLLTDEDVEIIKHCGFDQKAIRALEVMLDFYGMELKNNTINLAPNHRERLQVIKSHGKYYFVISRILSFLKELGEQKLMITWLKLLADLIQKNLLDGDAKISFNSYWIKYLDKNGFDEVKAYINEINRN